MTRLPNPDSAAAYEAYSRYFPLNVPENANQGEFLDVHRNPFGFLTQKGLLQLKESGHRFFNRYNHYAHHFPQRQSWRWNFAEDFLSVWNVSVYSTNYLRTVLSAQSFLDGLLGTHCYTPSSDTRRYDSNTTEETRVPNHSWKREDFGAETLVPVQVREISSDPLNAFDRNPDLMADLISEVITSEEFQSGDSKAAPLAARLANVLPGLVRFRLSDVSQRSPSGINWVEASDHFVCRKAHGLQLAKFSDYEHDDRVEQLLSAMSHNTMSHLAWRFRQWYKNKPLLAAVTAPPLREIANQMREIPRMGDFDKRPFVLYACHDVTILGLLYAIRSSFLSHETKPECRFWPFYGTTLVFELVRLEEKTNDAIEQYVVRVLLNGQPVLSIQFNDDETPLGHGPQNMLTIHDFLELVTKLEDEGGHDYSKLLGG